MIHRFSSRRQPCLGRTFLAERLKNARAYDRIAGYFTSSLLEVVGEELESVQGQIRIVCNAQLAPRDVLTAQAAKLSIRRAWTSARPELELEQPGGEQLQARYKRLYRLLRDGKMQVRVIPEHVFGLLHGKAGVITLPDGRKTVFWAALTKAASPGKAIMNSYGRMIPQRR